MAYEPKVWKCGDVIGAEDLNHIEEGIANSGGGTSKLIVHENISGDIHTLDKTWQEIDDAFPNVVLVTSPETGVELHEMINSLWVDDTKYFVYAGDHQYRANDPNSNPSSNEGEN